jgi:cysteine desulfuration protein SufE
MTPFEQKREVFADNLRLLPDTEERFRYLIQLGRKFPPLEESLRVKENLLPGCMSSLWFCPEFRDGLCHFHMDADAALVKGVAALFCALYSGETPETVLANEPDFLEENGLTMHLSSRRLTGLGNLRGAIKKFALAHCTPPDSVHSG